MSLELKYEVKDGNDYIKIKPEENTRIEVNNNVESQTKAPPKKQEFACELCGVCFSFKGNLNRHQLLHRRPDKPHKCGICEKGFMRREHLAKHLLSHADELFYECDMCYKKFKYRSSLLSHFKYHDRLKRFRCYVCNAGFTRRGNMNAHVAAVHIEEAHECEVCKLRLPTRYGLDYHRQQHFRDAALTRTKCDKGVTCGVCGKSFAAKVSLQNHVRIHGAIHRWIHLISC